MTSLKAFHGTAAPQWTAAGALARSRKTVGRRISPGGFLKWHGSKSYR